MKLISPDYRRKRILRSSAHGLASLRLHRTVPAIEGGPTTVWPALDFRLMVRRTGPRVRCLTRNGHDWADRFPAIVDAALRIKASSFLIDNEVVIISDDGMPDFHALRSKRRGRE